MFCLMYLLSYNPDPVLRSVLNPTFDTETAQQQFIKRPYKIVITLLLFLIATPSNRAVMVELHVA